MPSVLTFGFVGGIILSVLFTNLFLIPFLFIFLTIFLVGLLMSLRQANLNTSLLVTVGIILTHMAYGIFFIRGLTIKKLKM